MGSAFVVGLGLPVVGCVVYAAVVVEAGGEEVWGAFFCVCGVDGDHAEWEMGELVQREMRFIMSIFCLWV